MIHRPRPSSRTLVALLGLLGSGVLTGCSDGDSTASPAQPPAAADAESTADCPAPTGAGDEFPAGLPADFPVDFPPPAGARDAVADDSDPAVVSARFPSPTSLRDSVSFVVDQLPANGFEITGGDREPHEADVVFAKGDLRGQLRIARVDDCTTFWLVQVLRPQG